jgi:hypothetical protein
MFIIFPTVCLGSVSDKPIDSSITSVPKSAAKAACHEKTATHIPAIAIIMKIDFLIFMSFINYLQFPSSSKSLVAWPKQQDGLFSSATQLTPELGLKQF